MPNSMRQFKANVFQALGHPTRVAIVEFLAQGELSVSQLCEKVGVEQANASQHLAILRNRQIVDARKAGNQMIYRLSDPLFGEIFAKMRDYYLAQLQTTLQNLQADEQAKKGA